MLSYNEITAGVCITLNGKPYEVLSSRITKKQRQKPSNQTKLKSLVTGKVIERAFHQSDTAEEAEITARKLRHLYHHQDDFWFADPENPRERTKIDNELIGGKKNFLKENTPVDILYFDGTPIGIKLPIKVDLLVAEAPPTLRGDTTQGGNKQVTLETGMVVTTPLFISEGDTVRINTETGEYVERVKKI